MSEEETKRLAGKVAEKRSEIGRKRFKEVMLMDPPAPATPYIGHGVIDSVFGELWNRPGLSRRDRRWITLSCVAASAVPQAIQSHVYAALASGDISREEFNEFVLHFAYYAGWPRASALQTAYFEVVAMLDAKPSDRDE